MSCFLLLDRLDDFLDDELDPWARRELEAHLGACPECRARVAHERAVLASVRRAVRGVPVPWWLGARVGAAIAAERGA